MPISSINRVKTITQKLNPSSQNSIVPIYQNSGVTIGSELISGYKIVSFNTFIKNLKVFSQIDSVDEATLPNFEVEDSATDKLYKTLDIEWKSPRKQLSLYIASGTSEWAKVGSLSLLNPSGYPFRIYNLMDLFTDNLALELGDNSKIGISVDEVGYGLLTNTDNVVVHGSYVEEFFVVSPDAPAVIINNLSGSTPSEPDYSLSNNASLDNNFILTN